MTANELQTQRRQAAWRQRRVIYNNDGCDASANGLLQEARQSDDPDRVAAADDPAAHARLATPEAFWSQRCTGLEETDVDAIFYCSTISFNLHTHDSRVAELYTAPIILPTNGNLAGAWIAGGRDCLQLTIDFCRQHDMEVAWSLRMNDGHDNWYPTFCPEFKKRHPGLLLFQDGDGGRVRTGPDWPQPYLYATAVDYGRQEIRDRQFAIIEDVCWRYDIDCIELDFLRNPIFFRPTLECRPCDTEHLEIMTGFIRRVREMTEAVGRERDKPMLVASRVPSQVDCCRKIGLDIERWLADDLIDIVVSSLENDPFTGPVGELVELGHRHDAPVYAGASEMQPDMSGLEMADVWAGIATNAWNAGVDGMYIFNADPKLPEWHAIGDPARLATMDKVFAVDNLLKERGKEHVYPQAGRLPVELSFGEAVPITLPVGDDLAAGELRNLSLRIYIDGMSTSDEIEFKLNGDVIEAEVIYHTDGVSPVVCSNFFLLAQPDPGIVRKGDNEFTALVKKRCESASEAPVVSGLALVVKYKR
jgi:hypothetical protein